MKVFVVGMGQVGTALKEVFDDGSFVDIDSFDVTKQSDIDAQITAEFDVIINSSAITNVDGCEEELAEIAQQVNVEAVGKLAAKANELDIPFVHISSEYVFDGEKPTPYIENDSPNPKSVYAQTKADGDKQAELAKKHYIVRTSWVVGEGHNFVRTMMNLAQKGVEPSVVNDQIGRPTFTHTIAEAIKHLYEVKAPYGLYNVTGNGEPASWLEVAQKTYEHMGKHPAIVVGTSTKEYFKDKPNAATRPLNSVLDLSKIEAVGFTPTNWVSDLERYVKENK